MDGWDTIVSFWGPAYFQWLLLLVSGRVLLGIKSIHYQSFRNNYQQDIPVLIAVLLKEMVYIMEKRSSMVGRNISWLCQHKKNNVTKPNSNNILINISMVFRPSGYSC